MSDREASRHERAVARRACVLFAVLALAGCDAPGTLLVVDLRTNLLPGVHFERVRTVVHRRPTTRTDPMLAERLRTVSVEDRAPEGLRVAEIGDLAPGSYYVGVELLDRNDRLRAERTVAVNLRGRFAVTVLVSHECADVVCEPGLTCVGGRCVDPGCLLAGGDLEPTCPSLGCLDGRDCPPGPACTRPTCLPEGGCYLEPDDAQCASGELCDVVEGCVRVASGDGGVAQPRDAGADCTPSPEQCNGRDDDCDGWTDEDFDLSSDASNCGACANACTGGPGALPACLGGTCRITCDAGRADCDGNPANGCEAELSRPETCGSCARACAAPTPFCEPDGDSFDCEATCDRGLTACGSSCVDTSTSPTHCGGCGTRCGLGESCAGGICRCSGGSACATGRTCCAETCADLQTSVAHCGACGVTCVRAGATAACVAGRCTIGSCNAATGDCDGVDANGCEVNVRTDPAHCGGCGRTCAPPNAMAACSSGSCSIVGCAAGRANCDGVVENGCEVSVQTSPAHCGACGNVCGPYPNATAGCASGSCVAICAAGRGNCDGSLTNGCEVSVATDPTSCGSCGNVCGPYPNATAGCAAGRCVIASCSPNRASCDGNVTNGCEVDLQTNASHCGACGRACGPYANASAGCSGGNCAITGCLGTYRDCDGAIGNGCETDVASNNSHCGTCGNACAASSACSRQLCCALGRLNCDGVLANGCEVVGAVCPPSPA